MGLLGWADGCFFDRIILSFSGSISMDWENEICDTQTS